MASKEICLYPPVPVVHVPVRLALRDIKPPPTTDSNKDDNNSKNSHENDEKKKREALINSNFTNFIHRDKISDIKIFIDGVQVNNSPNAEEKKKSPILSSISKFFSGDSNNNQKDHFYGTPDAQFIPLNKESAIFIPGVEHANKELTISFTMKKKTFELKSTIEYRHQREWTSIGAQDGGDDAQHPIRIMQYNIQADCYTSPGGYPGCPPYSLYRNYREHVLSNYILEWKPDIACLQEVEVRMERLRNSLVDAGYQHTPLCDLAKYQEEQAIVYYRTDRFDLIESLLVNYRQLKDLLKPKQLEPLARSSCTSKYIDLLGDSMHHNKFSFALLKDKQSGSHILAGSVHLYWGAPSYDVNYFLQVVQLQIFMKLAENILERNSLPKDTPLVVSGDFNNGPGQKAYILMESGEYSLNGYPLTHSFNMKSSYALRPQGEPKYTIRTKHFFGSIDQIWVSDKLKVSKILEIGDHYPIQLPSLTDPSDHIMLLADLYVSNNNDKLTTTTTTTTTTSTTTDDINNTNE
ncbi:hypothetical protein CYY_001954 [Polysphondylium violaceum]|uniref:Endonuclease/exonuclease/phosphatase domain-containing protein n=1 Tax=Polysphondylium violaceum TaxID=133409 RepID=A0A8J4Q0C2_9MYCE|nr:hypothetical protein CYY_001954 [Polysphondylium violaceum]